MIPEEEQLQYDLALERTNYQQAELEKRAALQGHGKNKMGWGTFLFALILSLIADIAEISVVALPLVFFIDIILGLILGFSKGASKQWKKWIAGFLPIPLLRVGLLIWAFISSRSAKLQAVSGLTQKKFT